jgi:hypothetical protein
VVPLYGEVARAERRRACRGAPPAPSRAARLSAASRSAGDAHRAKRLFLVVPLPFRVENVSASSSLARSHAFNSVRLFARPALHDRTALRVAAGSAA